MYPELSSALLSPPPGAYCHRPVTRPLFLSALPQPCSASLAIVSIISIILRSYPLFSLLHCPGTVSLHKEIQQKCVLSEYTVVAVKPTKVRCSISLPFGQLPTSLVRFGPSESRSPDSFPYYYYSLAPSSCFFFFSFLLREPNLCLLSHLLVFFFFFFLVLK